MNKSWLQKLVCFWMAAQLIGLFPATSLAEKTGVAIANVIIRTQPTTESDGQRTVKEGGTMTILDDSISGWYKVQHGVIIGYASKDFVKIKSSSSTTTKESLPSSISGLGDAPSACCEGDRGDDVEKLQKALKILGYYSGGCDGIYGENTVKAVKAFQKSRGLTQDGVAGKSTIKYLFGEEASSTYKTEKPDWFDGGSELIPKGATFTIKDVDTGETFRARRWSGYNHLDAEPLTAKETATMKSIFGGSWSWTRRAILILYDGHVYAASMNGYPHGEQTIYDNDFEGHFCIHFYNSRTHETDREDEAHQAAVAKAAKATWD